MTSDYLRRLGCVLHFSVVEETRRDVAHDHTASGGRASVAPKPTLSPPRPLFLPLTSTLPRPPWEHSVQMSRDQDVNYTSGEKKEVEGITQFQS